MAQGKVDRSSQPGKPRRPAARPLPSAAPPPLDGEAERARIAAIFGRLAEQNPEPRTELGYHNPYTLLVAVVLSAQATDVSVNKATESLFMTVNTPAAMLEFGEERFRHAIRTIGLYNAKAKNVMALSERLVREFGGEVPRERHVLETLPGVGKKTAAVVVNSLHGDEAIAVDTHVFRVSNRMPIATGVTPDKVEAGLLGVVPQPYIRHAHHWLILHGRYTCTARKPLCGTCIVSDLCGWPDKTA